MRFIQKHKVLLGILSFLFIGLPEYVDAIWSLMEKIQGVGEIKFNMNWLYLATAPIGFTMLGFIIWQSYKGRDGKHREQIHTQKWEHYSKLVDNILKLENADKKDRALILADIQRELTEIGDEKIDKIMKPFFDVTDWEDEFGLQTSRPIIRVILQRTREYMSKKYKRRG